MWTKIKPSLLISLFSIAIISQANIGYGAVLNNDVSIKVAYLHWVKAIESAHGNPKAVVALYAPNAILLATFSPHLLINNNHGLDKYFASFTGHKNLRCSTLESIYRRMGNVGLSTGLYTFTYYEKGKKMVVPARFTFVYQKINNQWLIINHHSSIEPSPKGKSSR